MNKDIIADHILLGIITTEWNIEIVVKPRTDELGEPATSHRSTGLFFQIIILGNE